MTVLGSHEADFRRGATASSAFSAEPSAAGEGKRWLGLRERTGLKANGCRQK